MEKLKEWVKRNKVWIQLVVLAVTFGGGLAIGLSNKRIETVEKRVEVQVTTEAQMELMRKFEDLRMELQRVRETQVTEKYHREELETRLADGTYTKKVTVDKNIDSHTKETETKVEVKVVQVDKEVLKVVEVEKKVEVEKIVKQLRPDWDVSVKVGGLFTEIPNAIANGTGHSPIVIGVEVDRRIAGPFKLGLWANSNLAFNNVSGGISAGLEF